MTVTINYIWDKLYINVLLGLDLPRNRFCFVSAMLLFLLTMVLFGLSDLIVEMKD